MATTSSSKRQLVHTSNTYQSNSDLTVGGDLFVNGATTTIDTTNLLVEDHNIVLGNVSTPTDTTAHGGGITLKGASDYTINWHNSGYWEFNQGITVGENGTGHDVVFYGDTSDRYLTWDQSADRLNLRDSVQLTLGTHSDLSITHDGANSIIAENGTGDLYLQSNNASIYLRDTNSGNVMLAAKGGSGEKVELYYGGGKKLETGAGGITVTGKMTSDSITTALSLEMFASSGHNYISSQSSGSNLYIRNTGGGQILIRPKTGEEGIVLIPDGAVKLYHNNVLRLSTTDIGVHIDDYLSTDHINMSGELNFTGNGSKYIDVFTLANSNSFNIRHHNPSGNLYETAFQSVANGATTLYYNGGARFATTTDGIQLYGNGYIDLPDNGRARFGQSQDLAIYHTTTGPNSYIDNITGDLFIRNNSNDCVIIGHNANKGLIYCPDGRVELRFNDVKKFETTNDGIKVSHDGNVGALLETDADNDSNFLFFKSASSTRQVYVGAESTAGSNFSGTLAAAAVFGGVSSGQATQIISGGGSTHVKMTVKHDGDVGIATTSPTEKLDVRGTSRIGYTSTNGHLIGSKSYSVTQTFSTGLTVTLGNHQACHVKVFISGDWSNHSSIAYVGEFFIQNADNNSSSFNEPGLIISEHDNLVSDGILSKIVDGTSDSFEIQFRANTNSATSVSARLCYHVMGDASAVS